MERWFLQSKEIFSCSAEGRWRISKARSSSARRSSAPRSRSRVESGPEKSTKISGFSQSLGAGGSTTIRYLRWSPPLVTTDWRNSLMRLAAASLSIGRLSALSHQLSALSYQLERLGYGVFFSSVLKPFNTGALGKALIE